MPTMNSPANAVHTANRVATLPPCDRSVAFVTPSFWRDLEQCRELNESILTLAGPKAKHYIVVDACDYGLFRPLENSQTVIATVEDVIPKGYHKLSFSKKWWFSTAAMYPVKGWLVQQLVKLSVPSLVDEAVLVNVDSDVRFVRPVDPEMFFRDGRTRMYRLRGGVTSGMEHVKWHRNVCRMLGLVESDELPLDDYVGNMISWDRRIIPKMLEHVERTTGVAWHVAFSRARLVSEYLTYGLFVDKVIGPEAAGVWIDERSWCHTYWGPEPLPADEAEAFTRAMRHDDVAFSIASYTHTAPETTRFATELAVEIATSSAIPKVLSS